MKSSIPNKLITNRRLIAAICVFLSTVAAIGSSQWVVRFEGVGPVRIGMSLAQLSRALHEEFAMPDDPDGQACFYAEPARHPGVAFMVEDGRVTRVDATQDLIATDTGIRVGDPEEKIIKTYGRRAKVEPHFYIPESGHYLTIYSADGKYGVRFETDAGKITGFYAGERQAIQYVEGCL